MIDVFSKFKDEFLLEYKEEENYEYKELIQGSFDIGHEIIIHQNISSINDACECIRAIIRDNKLVQNDTCILSSKILTLQQIENKFSNYEKTTTAFETFSDIKDIEISIEKIPNEQLKKNSRKSKIEKLRKIKKDHFHINSGLVKFSTIHSFKGLELKNVFIIVHQDDIPEIIYTGITRSIENLFIISIGNTQYDEFFKSVVSK
ncbi:ATP-binding domain-containing protein [Moraxella cuniculi]|uniref:Uncharacterized protein n=1 Tax=Moraxella cuniculi TaxID=34061 RepID=A0A3S4QP78_9GAMM|nr:ATP-binding domain-containing protein [Moraxella cuniculi]VEG12898.1 Uncharacterised protein [Moraxella cuniculi]